MIPDRAAGAGIAAVILAAGASMRMGAPKPLLLWRHRTFVGHVVDRAHAVGCVPIVVVTGAHPFDGAGLAPATIVHNPRWAEGPTISLQRGLQAVGDVGAVIVATVDRPHVAPSTWAALIDAYRREPGAVWQPEHAERRGHPLLLPAWVLPRALGLAATASLRDVLAMPDIAKARRVFATDDAAVLDNLDTPADLARLPV